MKALEIVVLVVLFSITAAIFWGNGSDLVRMAKRYNARDKKAKASKNQGSVQMKEIDPNDRKGR